MSNISKEQQDKLTAYAIQRVALVKRIVAAALQAGYTVSGYTKEGAETPGYTPPEGLGMQDSAVFVLHKPSLPGYKLPVEVKLLYRRGLYGGAAGNGVEAGNGGCFRKREKRWTNFDTVEAKVLAFSAAREQMHTATQASKVKADEQMAHFTGIRQREIGAVVLPPGVSFDIEQSSDFTVTTGRYAFKLLGGWRGFAQVRMSAEQVHRLAALLNEIYGTADRYVIREVSGRYVSTLSNQPSYARNVDSAQTFTKAEAEKALEVYGDKSLKDAIILPYAEAYLSGQQSSER